MERAGHKVTVEFSCPMTRRQADAICDRGREAVIFVLMELAARLAAGPQDGSDTSPSTPSGMVPPYKKPPVGRRRKKPGAKPGHPGTHRGRPPQITRREEHPALQKCPCCGSPLTSPAERRLRLVEDVVEAQPQVTEHSIPRQWCAECKTFIEPPVPDAMPGAALGHRVVALTAWLHYGLGITISHIVQVLNHQLHFPVSQGGLVAAWQRAAKVLSPWYEQIADEVKRSGVLHADETGWRVNGQSQWLWCFTTRDATSYMIDRSRGSPALSKFFTQTFDGILVSDFWAAYNAVGCAGRQACLPHLFRELEKVNQRDSSRRWAAFAKKLKRLLRDAVRLSKRDGLAEESFASRRARLDNRLDSLVRHPWRNPNAERLVKRLDRYRDALFTFLDHADVPSDNNHAEREIRPAVIMRKNSLCNRSRVGAEAQAVLMSIYRTLRLRGRDPLETIVEALREYVSTGVLPPLPSPSRSDR